MKIISFFCIVVISLLYRIKIKIVPNEMVYIKVILLGLKLKKTPQLVLLTFDDALEDWAYPFYEKIVKHEGLKSSNGCPISMTFFVSHTHKENDRQVGITNYEFVNRLYNRGHEIASHTVT